MKTYLRKPENPSRTLDSPTRASRQPPLSNILQTYTGKTPQAPPPPYANEAEEKETPVGKLASYTPADDGEVLLQKKENPTGLPNDLKTGVEALSGCCMDDVRVHYNSPKPASLQAQAYTLGTDIHVGPGQEKHLPHETWHVVQQKQGRVQPTRQLLGMDLNDNEGLEQEADRKGKEAVQLKGEMRAGAKNSAHPQTPDTNPNADRHPATRNESGSTHSHTLQRMVIIGNSCYDKRNHTKLIAQVRAYFSAIYRGAIPKDIDLYIQQLVAETCQTKEMNFFLQIEEYSRWIHSFIAQQEDLKRSSTSAADWWANPNTEGFFTLDQGDPLFQELSALIRRSHTEEPYATDALHETSPIMQAHMNHQIVPLCKAIGASLFSVRKEITDRPDFEITRIQMIKNKRFLAEYEQARREIETRSGAGSANERGLFSGHGPQGMEFISVYSHDPSFGQYDRQKGHGAHGRGAYFTGQVDKALSYSRSGQEPEEERSFFLQRVLLGNSFEYRQKGRFRHQHHNEMVRIDRSQRNKMRKEGVSQTPRDAAILRQCDSLTGRKSIIPGNGLFGTVRDREKFDSDEYMVRNADQVYVQFRIYYKLGSPPESETGALPISASSDSASSDSASSFPAPPIPHVLSQILSTVPTGRDSLDESGSAGRRRSEEEPSPLSMSESEPAESSLRSPLAIDRLSEGAEAASSRHNVAIAGDIYTIDGTRQYNILDNSGAPGMCLWNIFLNKDVSEEHLIEAAEQTHIQYGDYVDVFHLQELVNAINRVAGTNYTIYLDIFSYAGTYAEALSGTYGNGSHPLNIGLVFLEDMGHYVEKLP